MLDRGRDGVGTTSAYHIFNSGIINMYVENLHVYLHERHIFRFIFSHLLASSSTRNAYVRASFFYFNLIFTIILSHVHQLHGIYIIFNHAAYFENGMSRKRYLSMSCKSVITSKSSFMSRKTRSRLINLSFSKINRTAILSSAKDLNYDRVVVAVSYERIFT